ncbi:hypothetical protein ACFWGR_35620, partial [Streptomyces sp. NPDC060311]
PGCHRPGVTGSVTARAAGPAPSVRRPVAGRGFGSAAGTDARRSAASCARVAYKLGSGAVTLLILWWQTRH